MSAMNGGLVAGAGSPRWERDGVTWPARPWPGAPGELVLRRDYDGPGGEAGHLTVLHADPVTWWTAPLLHLALERLCVPQLAIEPPAELTCGQVTAGPALTCPQVLADPELLLGWRIRVTARPAAVLYVAQAYLPGLDVYECRWPD